MFKSISVIAVSLVLFSSCNKDGDNKELVKTYSNGMFITNEGNFGKGNGSVSFVDNKGVVDTLIFERTNKRPLGDQLQSMEIIADKAYLTLSNSNKIEVVDAVNFKEIGVVAGLSLPRYVNGANSKLYVTQWGATGTVEVFNADTFEKVKSIAVGIDPDKMLKLNNELWVANSSSGFGSNADNTISVINTDTDNVVETISLSANNPRAFVTDKDGDVWVLCSGYVKYDPSTYALLEETPSMLIEIDVNTKKEKSTFKISDTSHPSKLVANNIGDTFYYTTYGGVTSFKVESNTINLLFDKPVYGINIDEDDNIYLADAKDYISNGDVLKYNSEGKIITSFKSGIIPNGVVFSY